MPGLTRTTWVYIVLAGAAIALVGVLAVRMAGTGPPGGDYLMAGADATALPGRALMGGEGCLSCHNVDGQGGFTGPPLGSEVAAKGEAWLQHYMTSGEHIDVYPGNGHAAFNDLTPEQARQIAHYLAGVSVSGRFQGPSGSPAPEPGDAP
jgi:mono/diheme cytochrome c family protein